MMQTNYQLTIESVRGEMKRDGKTDQIEVRSFEFGVEVARDGASGQASQRRRYTDVTFTKLVDRSSPSIQQLLATNGKIKKATLTVEKAGDKDADGKPLIYYRLILSDAYISSYKICGEELDDEFGTIPRDEFSINFRKIDVEYTEQHRSGGGAGAVMFSDELDSNR